MDIEVNFSKLHLINRSVLLEWKKKSPVVVTNKKTP
jgi:hypothetical protein